MPILKKLLITLLFPFLLPAWIATAQGQELITDTAPVFDGDVGIGVNHVAQVARSDSSASHVIPYANFDYGNFFARVDTFGYKMSKFGYGNIELVTRVIGEGYTPVTSTGDLDARKSSIPVGLGTLQIMPLGAVILNAYHDMNQSGGNLVDLIFAEQWKSDAGAVALYPQAGSEYRSRNYVRYFYGVSAAEASQFNLTSYTPGESTSVFVALFMELQISGNWYLNANVRRTWLDTSISESPLARTRNTNSGFAALSYRFN